MAITKSFSQASLSIFAVGLIIGVSCAVSLYALVVSRSTAIGIVKLGVTSVPVALTGGVKTLNETSEIQPLGLTIERLKTDEFAREIANFMGRPDLERGIQQKRFGGLGWLSARPLKEINSIEVKVQARDDVTSVAIAQSVLKTIFSEQVKIYEPFVLLLDSRLADLEEQERVQVRKIIEWDSLIGDSLPTLSVADRILFLSRRQIAHENVYKIRKTIDSLNIAKIRSDIEGPKILNPVALVRRSQQVLILMILLGAVAGLIGAFLSIQIYQLLKKGSPHPENDEPSAKAFKRPS